MKRFLKVSFMLATLAVVLSSCNCYNRMQKRVNDVRVTANPAVLSLRGSSVSTDVTVVFPAGYFNPNAVLRITPVMVFAGGEIAGTPKFLQGTKVRDNFTVVDRRAGGSYTQTITFPFDERMRISSLELRIEARCINCKRRRDVYVPITTLTVAKGVSTVQQLADNSAFMTIMADNFRRVTSLSEDAAIMYEINRSVVRPAELTKEQIRMFEEFIREKARMDRASLGPIYAKGYASPEGPLDFNEQLSKDRSVSGKEAMSKELSSVNPTFDVAAYGEDWDGFKKLVAASNIKDRDLILQVLEMYSNPMQREQEIRNMASVFNVLKVDILPQLRRTVLTANADITGRTDAEILSAATGNIDALGNEELLFAATLTQDNALKARLYEKAATKYSDPRAFNNLGVVLARQGKLTEAKAAFDRAASLGNDAAITNNLGALALMNGNTADAKRYLSALNTADSRANMGLVNLAEGNYAEAAKTLTGYNLAVAQVLNGNLSQAKTALGNDASAQADYLRAIIAMREGDSNAGMSNLKSAVSKDSSLRAQAKRDIEFAKLFGTAEFNAL